MTEAFIYDHVRTPRGKGKPDGSLHTVSTLHLAAASLKAIKSRNGLQENQIDDVVMGCVDPVGEAGGDIPRMAALAAGLDAGDAGLPGRGVAVLTCGPPLMQVLFVVVDSTLLI